jgi:hypothetical protein
MTPQRTENRLRCLSLHPTHFFEIISRVYGCANGGLLAYSILISVGITSKHLLISMTHLVLISHDWYQISPVCSFSYLGPVLRTSLPWNASSKNNGDDNTTMMMDGNNNMIMI